MLTKTIVFNIMLITNAKGAIKKEIEKRNYETKFKVNYIR